LIFVEMLTSLSSLAVFAEEALGKKEVWKEVERLVE